VIIESLPAGSGGPFLVGTLAAMAVGLVAIDVLLGYVRRHDYSPFAIYRIAVAIAIVAVIASGARHATF
jgi:undecaprenyl-diphosphatase